jgi:hypothetical protein
MSVSNNKTSHLISSQVPQFVKDDHETFVTFLEDYYKFLEQSDQAGNVAKNFLNYKNVDLSEGEFLQKIYDNFIKLLPEKILADKKLILKHVKDFYRARGTEKSVRFLLRILLNKEIDFYYPKRDILRASDGKWFIEKSLRVGDLRVNNTSNTIAYNNFINKRITGITSGATAIVETVDIFYDKGQLVTELKLSNEYRSFIDGEKVYCLFEEETGDKHLSANLFSGVVVAVSLINGGAGYTEGATVPIVGDGTGAQVVIASTTRGSLTSIGVSFGGAGFRANDGLIITGGGGGVGASGNVYTVDLSEKYHPNSYNLISSTINLETNTPINNVRYNNLNSSIVNPLNHWIQNSMSFWSFSNCGPVTTCLVLNGGDHYDSSPFIDVQSNTVIRSLGILGRMEIINGGLNYVVGDELVFTNPNGCYGTGAKANVSAVAANGMITEVKFRQMPGHFVGGSGYDQSVLPTISVSTSTGSGANVIVRSILGDGDSLVSSSVSYGQITELKLISGGTGYSTAPILDFDSMTSGNGAQAVTSIVTGAYTYPGRFLNDDGFISAYNFLQDRDYYQNFSYVIRVDESINKYRKAIKDLVHPAGMKLFGDYVLTDYNDIDVAANTVPTVSNNKLYLSKYRVITDDVTKTGTYNVTTLSAEYAPRVVTGTYNVKSDVVSSYTTIDSNIVIYSPSHNLTRSSSVYLKFHSDMYPNITNGLYTVSSANTNYLIVPIANGNSAFYTQNVISSNLTASSGSGITNNYITLSSLLRNSNVAIAIGDSLNINSTLVDVVYANSNSNESLIIVYPGITGSLTSQSISVIKKPYTANGNVSISNPVMTLFANNTGLVPGDNVYVKFSSNDTSLINTRYQVLTANATLLRVQHKDISNSVSRSGSANVHLNTITVTSINHSLDNNEIVYMAFYSGDTSNASNGVYTVNDVTQNTFNLTTTYPVTQNGSAYIKTSNVTLNIISHGFTDNNSIRMWFTSGDTANISNDIYTVSVVDANTMFLDTANVLSTNGNIVIYRGYANVSIFRESHDLLLGNTLDVLFDSGNLTNITNGVFTITDVANTNQYNIKHTGITVSSNLTNLLPNNTGNVYVSLHK